MPVGIVSRSAELPLGVSFLKIFFRRRAAALFQRALQAFRTFLQLPLELIHLIRQCV
jgi:hypothetical protein